MSAEEIQENLLESEDFRRLLAWSAGGHLILALLLVFGQVLRPASRIDASPVFVEVVAVAPQPPAPPPPRQVVKEVVIPKQPEKLPEPKPPPRRVEKKPEPPPPSADQILAQLRQKVSDRPAKTAAPASAAAGRFDPEMAVYQKRIQSMLYANWAGARHFLGQGELVAHFEADVLASGQLRSVELVGSSGNRYFDESAERAIRRAAPFPEPPLGRRFTLTLTFDPREGS